MKTRVFRARGAAMTATSVALLALLAGACDVSHELLAPQQPGVIDPGSVNTATAANALWAGAMGDWNDALNGGGGNNGSLLGFEGLFTDEFRSSDTFTQRNDADQRRTATNDGVMNTIYTNLQQSRGRSRDAINALIAYDPSATGTLHTGEMYLALGHIELQMAEAFCNGLPFSEMVDGTPQYGVPLTTAQATQQALAHFDTALTYLNGTDDGFVNVRYATLVAKARAQVDLADFSGAAATVASVPTSFQYNLTYSQTTFDNNLWTMGPSIRRYNAGDSTDVGGRIYNAIPFARLNDPRVLVTNLGFSAAEDHHSEYFQVDNWGRDDPMAILTGIDARLIEAEAKLNASDVPGVMTILNDLRTNAQLIGALSVPAMAALPTPADQIAATNLFFREKALWQFGRGYRMGDLRRLVRQYGRAEDQVFPAGPNFVTNGTPTGPFGTLVAFPVPDNEKTNPNFKGCLDGNA